MQELRLEDECSGVEEAWKRGLKDVSNLCKLSAVEFGDRIFDSELLSKWAHCLQELELIASSVHFSTQLFDVQPLPELASELTALTKLQLENVGKAFFFRSTISPLFLWLTIIERETIACVCSCLENGDVHIFVVPFSRCSQVKAQTGEVDAVGCTLQASMLNGRGVYFEVCWD